ncbi:MAG TPA: site-2 protease family protein [Pirellulaceae bacterium]|jgi:Zn-dependent protease|nr:site-2 protease family protein [Pirellulaceae bacterium]
MFLLEPPRTQFDLNFRIGSIPVRIHPFFWLVSLIMFASGGMSEANAPMLLAIWVGVVFFSILIHELGHAVVMRYYGDHPSVVLYSFGGLAIPGGEGGGGFYDTGWRPRARLTPIRKIQISFAGPLAGFLVAAATIVLCQVADVETYLEWRGSLPIPRAFVQEKPGLNALLNDILWVNLAWGLVNLLPIYPLDGGQIARELFTLAQAPDGLRKSLYLSMFTAVGAAILMFSSGLGGFFVLLLFGSLAFSNWQMIQQMSRY